MFAGGSHDPQRLRDDLRAGDAGVPRVEQDGRRLPGFGRQIQVEVAPGVAERAKVRQRASSALASVTCQSDTSRFRNLEISN